jgi:hypothetical protein
LAGSTALIRATPVAAVLAWCLARSLGTVLALVAALAVVVRGKGRSRPSPSFI